MFIAKIIRLHNTFNDGYLLSKKDWSVKDLLHEVKSRAEGNNIEALFNIYCDTYSASVSDSAREMIKIIFNQQDLYTIREYLVKY